eukprot:scaffold4885_cov309-Prasinococcus_capsulatus_cf.AAC.5
MATAQPAKQAKVCGTYPEQARARLQLAAARASVREPHAAADQQRQCHRPARAGAVRLHPGIACPAPQSKMGGPGVRASCSAGAACGKSAPGSPRGAHS